jgi:hypothetical protein
MLAVVSMSGRTPTIGSMFPGQAARRSTGCPVRAAISSKSGTIWNYWSRNDTVLRRLYRLAQGGQQAAGAVGFSSKAAFVRNRNVSRAVASHSDYVKEVKLQ